MNIIAVDDEEFALAYLIKILRELRPQSELHGFLNPFDALDYMRENEADIAFLDVEMCGINGIELAKRFKDVSPRINIVFVTGFSDYAVEAFSLRASGYLLKPVSSERVEEELHNLRAVLPGSDKARRRVHTFGNFEIFVDDVPVGFARTKSKELLAYLVDRKGAGCTAAELSAIIWEDKEYNVSLQKQFQTLVSDMLKTLKQVKAEEIIIKKRNYFSVDTTKIDCDYYNFLQGDIRAMNAYTGEYMTNYSWAEFTAGFLYHKANIKKEPVDGE